MRNRWRVARERLKGTRRSQRKVNNGVANDKVGAFEQADIWNDMETSRVTGQAGER